MLDLFLSILTSLFLSSLFVSFSCFIPAVPMSEYLGEHLCMSSSIPITILIGNFFFPEAKESFLWPKFRRSKSVRPNYEKGNTGIQTSGLLIPLDGARNFPLFFGPLSYLHLIHLLQRSSSVSI